MALPGRLRVPSRYHGRSDSAAPGPPVRHTGRCGPTGFPGISKIASNPRPCASSSIASACTTSFSISLDRLAFLGKPSPHPKFVRSLCHLPFGARHQCITSSHKYPLQ